MWKVSFVFFCLAAHGQSEAPAPEPVVGPPPAPAESMDSERPLPKIFQAFEASAPAADSVIFMRSDFNDLIPAKNPVPFRFQTPAGD